MSKRKREKRSGGGGPDQYRRLDVDRMRAYHDANKPPDVAIKPADRPLIEALDAAITQSSRVGYDPVTGVLLWLRIILRSGDPTDLIPIQCAGPQSPIIYDFLESFQAEDSRAIIGHISASEFRSEVFGIDLPRSEEG